MRKNKILYIVSNLTKCGPINILYGIVRHINKKQFEINILTLSKENDNSMIQDFNKLGINIYNTGLSRITMELYGKKRFTEIVKKINPDIIHTHGIRAEMYTKKYITNEIFTTIHNYPHKDFVMEYGKIIGSYMAKQEIKIINTISNPVACSKSIATEMKKLFDCDMDYIQNGIDISKFRNISSLEKEKLKRKLGLKVGSKIIISVGRLIDRKNPTKILQSFIESDIKDEYTLVILGDGNLKDECKKYESPNVLILGDVSNVNEYLNVADIFISASKAEGLPNSVLEAMASELMVILSDINPHKEIIDYNIESGILFDLNNNELVDILNNIHKIDIKTRGLNCRYIVENYFTDKIMSSRYQEKYIKSIKTKEGGLNE